MRRSAIVAAAAALVVASTRCNETVDCFISGDKLNPSDPLQCAYLTHGFVCSDGHKYEVECFEPTRCMCLLDGQMTGAIPNSASVCGTSSSIADTQARYPFVARQCGWNILVTVAPQCPPNDCGDAAAD